VCSRSRGCIGPPPAQGWKAYERWLTTQSLPEPVALSVAPLLEMRAAAERQTVRLGKALVELAALPEYAAVVRALHSQRGVGPFTAIRLRLEIGDIHRFASAAAFVRYLGLTPSEYSSGEVVKRGHVLKCGPGIVRAWLIECAWASVGGRKPDAKLYSCFERIAARAGRKRAIVAVARRLARKLRALWLQALAIEQPLATWRQRRAAATAPSRHYALRPPRWGAPTSAPLPCSALSWAPTSHGRWRTAPAEHAGGAVRLQRPAIDSRHSPPGSSVCVLRLGRSAQG
jgi:hypothetical protein